ncbi:MAG: hypothetical protein ACLFT4_05525, partial [Bacteroidales bacterium]
SIIEAPSVEDAINKFADNSLYFTANAICEKIEEKKEVVIKEENSYILVPWPDVQEYMDKPWFNEEAELSQNQSDYFIPKKRIS